MKKITPNTNQIGIKNANRVFYFDYLRIVAIFAVIFLHTAAQNWYITDVSSFEWNVFNFYDSLVRWGVPVFVMISGALFLNKEQLISKLYRKNILRMLIILFFWSTIYATWGYLVLHQNTTLKDSFFSIVKGPSHLWFLYMLIGLYMVVPFLQKIIQDRKIAKYFVILSLVFAFIIPNLIKIINLKFPSIAEVLNEVINTMRLNFVLGYTGYFVLGYLLHNSKITKKTEIILYILSICSLIFTILSTTLLSNYLHEPSIIFYNNLSLNVCIISISVFIFFKQHIKNPTKRKINKLLFLSKCSLGVYLIHIIILDILQIVFNLNSLSFNPIFSIPTIAILVFISSYIISIILNKIPIVNKWLI